MPADDLHALFETLAGAVAPAVRDAVLQAFATLADRIDEQQLRDAISLAGGDPARLRAVIDVVLSDSVLTDAFQPLREAMRSAVVAGGQVAASSIPGVLAATAAAAPAVVQAALAGGDTIVVRFNATDPRLITALRDAELALFPQLAADVRAGARQLITDALVAGNGPAETARQVRPLLGLTEYQAQVIARQRARLTSGVPAEVRKFLALELRDARFDRTVATLLEPGASLTPEQVDRVVGAYQRGMLQQSAETLARTESLNALRRSNQAAWTQASDQLGLPPAEMIREWRTRMDGRERPAHHAMNGQTVALGEPWQVPGVGAQAYPGESEYNCRCVERIVPRWVSDLQRRMAA